MEKSTSKTNNYTNLIREQSLLMDQIFSEVHKIEDGNIIEKWRQELENLLLFPHQMMYLICYNPRGIFFAKNIENFLPFKDSELTIEKIIEHISPLDLCFVQGAIKEIYQFFKTHDFIRNELFFTIEHRMQDKQNQTIYIQRNTKLLEVDENNLPVLALSIITDITPITKQGFYPRASLYNSRTHDQYFYKAAQKQCPIWISKREVEVLELLCKGFTSKQIAEQLYISKHTVDGHRRTLLEKSSLSTTSELITFAIKNNWTN